MTATDTARLRTVRDELKTKLALHRGTSTRLIGGEYKNPVRKGYDIALTEAIELLDAQIKDGES